jgi:tricorn protease
LVSGSPLALGQAGSLAAPNTTTVESATRAGVQQANVHRGYYRMPALRKGTIVFVSEGDLFRVPLSGGSATRLTSHEGLEQLPAISPDGTTIAFAASYEGPQEIYTMPLSGGLPTRRTFDGNARINSVGWASNDLVAFSSDAGSTLPRSRMHVLSVSTGARGVLALDQCDELAVLGEGLSLDGDGSVKGEVVFTRLPFQGSHADRYKGGSVQNLWRFVAPGGSEATQLLATDLGTSRRPLWSGSRVFFTSDRSGFLNIWSMLPDGSDLKQHTTHADQALPVNADPKTLAFGWAPGGDIGSSSIDGGTIVYQLGADLWQLDTTTNKAAPIDITLQSDLDNTRENWVDKPLDAASTIALSHDGEQVIVTARGRVFVVPVKDGRVVDADPRGGVRYRAAREVFVMENASPASRRLVAISDETGELELASLPMNGVGEPTRFTKDGSTVRWDVRPSPNGEWVASTDKRNRLWVHRLDGEATTSVLVEENPIDNIDFVSWSGDSRWLAFTSPGSNTLVQVKLYDVQRQQTIVATSDRYDSYSPRFDREGNWLYFLSDRTFASVQPSPWGPRAPEAFLDKQTRIYAVALREGLRWPFTPDDEVLVAETLKKKDEKKEEPKAANESDKKDGQAESTPATGAKDESKGDKKADAKKDAPKPVEIVAKDLPLRLEMVAQVPAGNYRNLMVGDKALYFEATEAGGNTATLHAIKVASKDAELKTVASGIRSSEMSGDGKRMLIRVGDTLHVIEPSVGEAKLDAKNRVETSGIAMSVDPREEWRQIAIDSWRLLRDYFYARTMHGVDWQNVLTRYLPLVERVQDRRELNDVLAQMTSELAALHHFVRGGDIRSGGDNIGVGALGAVLEKAADGWRVAKIYQGDPQEPWTRSPLAQQHVGVRAGDVIVAINGTPTLSVTHPQQLLRKQAGRQVLLRVKAGEGQAGEERDVIVRPLSQSDDAELRYRTWQVERREMVEKLGASRIGYVHLRAMGTDNFGEFARDFYPNFTREGLIIDVRDNRGGNIDSWLLSRLQRRAWMFWNQHAGRAPSWNMQMAFRGHMVVLINERTASDGEAFSEGFKRLGLGKLIGTRTWGGMIWLTSSNTSVDGGLASAGEFGVFDAKGNWLIEGHGVEPDITVDNTPHDTFMGKDRQLEAAVEHLQRLMQEQPVEVPAVPALPEKQWKGKP